MRMALTLTCLLAFIASFLLARMIRSAAVSLGKLDVPNERSSHNVPTPRGGGLSFVLITLTVTAFVAFLAESYLLRIYAGCAFIVSAVSLVDDFRSVPPFIRLSIHLAAGGAFVLVTQQPGRWGVMPEALVLAGMILWVASLTNIFNFMDGIDGIAASQAMVTFAVSGLYSILMLDLTIALICLVGASATAGFLILNWPPAKLFMGDVGSAFLGFTCACFSLMSEDYSLLLLAVFATWPFIFDAGVTLCRRLFNGENILRSHRSHLYQRLVIAGYSHRFVTTLYTAGAVVCAVAGLLVCLGKLPLWIAILILALMSAAVLLLVRGEEDKARVANRNAVT